MLKMSVASVLRNVYSFLDVLQAASTDGVKEWNKQALHNALQWATYSQQVWELS